MAAILVTVAVPDTEPAVIAGVAQLSAPTQTLGSVFAGLADELQWVETGPLLAWFCHCFSSPAATTLVATFRVVVAVPPV